MELKLTWIMLATLLINSSAANPIAINEIFLTDSDAEIFLVEYGYLNPSKIKSKDSYTTAIMEYQQFFDLDITGNFTDETKAMMTEPRCGNPDKQQDACTARKKRYAIPRNFARYPKKLIHYKITKYSSTLRNEEVDQEISKAFQVWTNQTGIIFKHARNDEPTSINIRFESGFHWDGFRNTFDGPGRKLAHAALPRDGHYIHFDDDERWAVKPGKGYSLLKVAVHEIGHKIGLDHSKIRSAVMFPRDPYEYIPSFELDPDDIAGIKQLYPPKNKT